MKYIILDTETSSVNPRTAEMYTLGAFSVETFDNGLLNIDTLKGIHRYFNTDSEVPGDAASVNGLSRKILLEKSGGDYLEDCVDELNDFIYQPDAVLVGYNVNYDKTVITNNLLRVGLNPPRWRNSMDIMQEQKPLFAGTGYDSVPRVKLVKAADIIFRGKKVATKEQLHQIFKVFVEHCGIEHSDAMYHSALYDAYITMMILRELLIFKNK